MARTTATNFTGGLQFPYATAAADLFHKEDIQVLAQAVDQHDHTTGKGLSLPASAIPAGFITGAMIADGTITSADIADGSITTVDLATNAVSQRASRGATIANPTTTSAAYVDLSEMAITMNTTGGELLVWLVSSFNNSSVSAVTNLAVSLDAAAEVAVTSASCSIAAVPFFLATVCHFPSVAAGTHTIKGRWSTSGGTAGAYGTQRFIIVEEIRR